jgi:hypothetical protein
MRWTSGSQALRSVALAIHKRRVEDQLRLGVSDLGLAPRLDLALHRLKVPLDSIHANRQRVDQIELKLLLCLASTGVNAPETMLPSSSSAQPLHLTLSSTAG